MEFRYQPVEDRPSTFFSSTTTNSYFTEQALRVGLISDNRSNEVVRDAVGVREAVNRELEKERIRAELIAAEVARRRVLEVEVRMELQMERELAALRRREGVSSILSDPRIPLMHHPNGGRVEERMPLTSFSEVDMRYPEGSRLEERLSFPSRLEIGMMHPEGSRAEGSRVADRLYFPGRPQIVEGLQFQRHPETTEISKGKAVFLVSALPLHCLDCLIGGFFARY
uniref:Uncharacterized protein n=1 Tax=Nelumbo nucifera TaxID=4432 RepID=A0A822ZP93_NELNU|nr:TPA_asm: hypothetical protein HUJ06_003545 [Nelumbo nucifera]